MNKETLEDISDRLEGIATDVETVWQRLEGIEYHLSRIAEYGILPREVEEAIVAIARSISKPFDEKIKEQENMIAGKV